MEIGRWTDITRAHHARNGLRLPSDLTDRQWAVEGGGKQGQWSGAIVAL
jgi:hypothetical protein